jgi:hypothetical protein
MNTSELSETPPRKGQGELSIFLSMVYSSKVYAPCLVIPQPLGNVPG